MQRYDRDHIDPDYPEGCDRPYQLVCGLTNPFNLVERDNSTNVSKSNRFLPWRVAKDEIGSVPVNPGDLCQFLDRATGDWVLEEFMGDWWFEQTRDLCGQSCGGKALSREQFQAMSRKSAQVQIENKIGIHGWTYEQRQAHGRRTAHSLTREVCKEGGETVNKQRHMCLVTGHISTPAGLSNYQRHKGIDLSRRVQLTPEECAFIYLWGEDIPREWLKETAKINLKKTGSTNLKKVTKEARSQTAKKLNSTLWMSLATGDISTAAGIHNIHKKAGLDKETSRSKRVKLTPEESAFIFLWG
jgi:hypothetical protein